MIEPTPQDPLTDALKAWGATEIDRARVRATAPMLALKARLARDDARAGRGARVERAVYALAALGVLGALAFLPAPGLRWGSPLVLVFLAGTVALLGASLVEFLET